MDEEREEYLSRTTGKMRKRRKDGWTKRDIETFLSHLRVTGHVSASAAAAGKSDKAAYNLRAVDAAFAAQMDAAEGEFEARLESRIALYAETGGKLPPMREDGEPAEAPLENFDPHLAMAYLNFRHAKRESRGRRGGPRPKSVSKEELVETFVKLMGMLKRRRAAARGAA
jgi:hypothetical protein